MDLGWGVGDSANFFLALKTDASPLLKKVTGGGGERTLTDIFLPKIVPSSTGELELFAYTGLPLCLDGYEKVKIDLHVEGHWGHV